jgi:CTP synthase
MQVMSVEFARNVLGLEDANSTEHDASCEHPVIDLMPDQHDVTHLGGTMRLGSYPCALKPGTRAAAAYQGATAIERHRHRFEFNNSYRAMFEEAGACFSGVSPDERLVEIMELVDHPFMVGSQFHPEFQSRPNRPHPLFREFIRAAIEYSERQNAPPVAVPVGADSI